MTLITNEQPDAREAGAAESGRLDVFIVGDAIEPAEVDLDEVPKLVQKVKRRGFVWLHLVDPDEDTVNAARETLGIHPTAAADVVSGRQQPKVQKFAEHLFILLWSILRDEDSGDVVLGQTYVYIGDGWLLTVQRGEGGELTDLPNCSATPPRACATRQCPPLTRSWPRSSTVMRRLPPT